LCAVAPDARLWPFGAACGAGPEVEVRARVGFGTTLSGNAGHLTAVSCASPSFHLPRTLPVWEWDVVAAALCRRPLPLGVCLPSL
jgi:hypothetical protein